MRRNVLLLQGPIGPFFSRFAEALEARGFGVTKVNFNGGDKLFYRRADAIDYTGAPADWSAWLEPLLREKRIQRIYVFGDCRQHHRVARECAMRLGIEFHVFEEGYIRPNFVTLERDGVNGHSALTTDNVGPEPAASCGNVVQEPPSIEERSQPRHIFIVTALYSMAYYLASRASRKRFALYRHHRPLKPLSEGSRWIVSGYRKLYYALKERKALRQIIDNHRGQYFVCPLQVHCDMQVVAHSDYASIEEFIGEVLKSFAASAPPQRAIVFKHHPLDRGYTDYSFLFTRLIDDLGLEGRVFYVHDICLPSLLRHAAGTVLVNSTVGLSSLFHGTPVKTLGRAVYDRADLVSGDSLARFWVDPPAVDVDAFERFRRFLIDRNQINGSLYRRLKNTDPSGLNWSEPMLQLHSAGAGVGSGASIGPMLPRPAATAPNLRLVVNAPRVEVNRKGKGDSSEAA